MGVLLVLTKCLSNYGLSYLMTVIYIIVRNIIGYIFIFMLPCTFVGVRSLAC